MILLTARIRIAVITISIGWDDNSFSLVGVNGDEDEVHFPGTKETTELQHDDSLCQVETSTFKKISLNPQQRQVSTNKSEGIYEFLYKMREMVKPSKDIQPGTCRKTEDECSVLECCFSEDTNNRGKVRDRGGNIIQKFNICLL